MSELKFGKGLWTTVTWDHAYFWVPPPQKKSGFTSKENKKRRERGGKMEHHEALSVAVKGPAWLTPPPQRAGSPQLFLQLCDRPVCENPHRAARLPHRSEKCKVKGEGTFWQSSSPNKGTVVALQTDPERSQGAGPQFQRERWRGLERRKLSLKQKTGLG